MRIAVIGGNGQLGSDLVSAASKAGHDAVALNHEDLRVEDVESVRAVLTATKPEVVFNTAAFHQVPRCEVEPDRAFAVNAKGALNVAQITEELGALNVFYSSDYVFDGKSERPYRESDRPNPLNVYATSKLAGECLTLNYGSRSTVLRVSGIYGRVPCRAKGDHFVNKMIQLSKTRSEVKVVTDEVLTPTPTREIARFSLEIAAARATGLYHLTCEGACSWYEFTREVFDQLGIQTPLVPAKVSDFPPGVRRPHYSVLENRRLRDLGIGTMPDWKDGLRGYLRGGSGEDVV